MSMSPFDGCRQQDILDVVLVDGTPLVGCSYLTQAGMHFVHDRRDGLHGKVHGPLGAADVISVRIIKDRDAVMAERAARKRGEPVPGTLRRTREGFEARLDVLARAAALATGKRRDEIEFQFDEVADLIELAKTKRNYILALARWARVSNQLPSKIDLSGGDMTSAARFQRPRPQDFDPDPKIRRAAVRVPPEIAADPRSPPNMLRALRAAGFNARRSILGETDFNQADFLVDFPGGKQNGRFALFGGRRRDGTMSWRFLWEGRTSKADDRRHRRVLGSDAFQLFKTIVQHGLVTKDSDPAPPAP